MQLKHLGKIKNGKLEIIDKGMFIDNLRAFEGQDIEVSIRIAKQDRTLEQNSYYWCVIIPLVSSGLIDLGHDRYIFNNKENTHNFLKQMFCNRIQYYDNKTNTIVTELPSTKTLNTKEMTDYIEDIRRFSSEFLGVNIPDADKVLV